MLTLNRERRTESEYDERGRGFEQNYSYSGNGAQAREFENKSRADELWSKLQYSSPNRVSFAEAKQDARVIYSGDDYDTPTKNVRKSAKSERSHSRGKMSVQGKVILAIYLVLAIVVISLIIVNSEVINGESEAVSTPTAIVEVSAANTETDVALADSQYEYENQTNWFDKLCDGLNSLFGE